MMAPRRPTITIRRAAVSDAEAIQATFASPMAIAGTPQLPFPSLERWRKWLADDLADNWLDYARLELTVYTDNAAALVLDRKFGFEIEGSLKSCALRGGRFIDAYAMARFAPSPAGPARKAVGGTARRKRPS